MRLRFIDSLEKNYWNYNDDKSHTEGSSQRRSATPTNDRPTNLDLHALDLHHDGDTEHDFIRSPRPTSSREYRESYHSLSRAMGMEASRALESALSARSRESSRAETSRLDFDNRPPPPRGAFGNSPTYINSGFTEANKSRRYESPSANSFMIGNSIFNAAPSTTKETSNNGRDLRSYETISKTPEKPRNLSQLRKANTMSHANLLNGVTLNRVGATQQPTSSAEAPKYTSTMSHHLPASGAFLSNTGSFDRIEASNPAVVMRKTKSSTGGKKKWGEINGLTQMNRKAPTETKKDRLTPQDVLEIIGQRSFNNEQSRSGKIRTPLQDLLSDNITENDFANILERQSPELRRISIKELVVQFKKLMSLLTFTSNIASELDMKKAINQITQQVPEILKADRATLFQVDENTNELHTKGKTTGDLRIPIGRGIAGLVAHTGEAVNIANAYTSPAFYPEITGYHTKSVLCMPVKDENNKLVAVLEALNKHGGAFGEEDEQIMKILCAQTAITLRNSQMYQSSVTSQQKISVLLEVAGQLASELETNALIQTIMDKAKQLLDADRCTMFLVDREHNELISSLADGTTEQLRIPLTTGIAGHVATTGDTLNIPDAYNDTRFNREVDLRTGYRTRTILCMPIRDPEGQVIGVTQVLNKRGGPFDRSDEELLSAFSAQAGIAVVNSQLFMRTRELAFYTESVLKSITNLVFTLNDQGRLTAFNRPTLKYLGISEDVMQRNHYSQWLSDNVKLKDDITAVYNGQSEISCDDYEFLSRDGKTISLKYTVAQLNSNTSNNTSHQGSNRGVVIIVEDISPHKKMKSTLSRYMSPALVEQVIKEGGDRLGGIHVTVSTLFIDIRDFTSLSEAMDAGEVVEMLNEYFSYMVNVVFEEEGVLDKYIGDAAMAVFGVPYPKPDDAVRACRAALGMLKNLAKFNAVRLLRGKPAIKVGIGINTGKVLSGNIGSEKRQEYTVIGDGVNLASRIEGVTKQYGVRTIISEYTYQMVHDRFITRELDSIRVVGKKQPIRIYELLALKEEEDTVPQNLILCECGISAPLTRSVLPMYDQGLSYYRSFEFAAACEVFRHCLELVPNDGPSRIFLKRSDEFMKEPPPSAWDGTYDMMSK
ncbi:GAF and PAS/PAC sensor-containing adenylate/guanylate cyclase [Planoprotostelium fungivorum]|uniref:GAF and PAS/PAC sensor-containing adenylate/guanylate cyclase n=1 Tax=Planoprotostelium fungivorum TaxID=1890364 RepID=A0A2P6NF17_9EUKA|nr:GAF and PAS/PAC sensor-containing adenylate/guanylate cyclase [Planoprotostelium fungivorum]